MAQTVKNLPAKQETGVLSLDWEDPLEKEMATHSSILAGESHGQRSLAGHSPYLTLWDPVNFSPPGFPVLHYLLELAQTQRDGP